MEEVATKNYEFLCKKSHFVNLLNPYIVWAVQSSRPRSINAGGFSGLVGFAQISRQNFVQYYYLIYPLIL